MKKVTLRKGTLAAFTAAAVLATGIPAFAATGTDAAPSGSTVKIRAVWGYGYKLETQDETDQS